MPLEAGKSKAAFSHNVETEMNAGKKQSQAVAIAYSKQRGDTVGFSSAPFGYSHEEVDRLVQNQLHNREFKTNEQRGDEVSGEPMEERSLQEKAAVDPHTGLGTFHDKVVEIYDSCLGLEHRLDSFMRARHHIAKGSRVAGHLTIK